MSVKAKIREDAKTLNPMDDTMFCKMAEEKEFCEEVLRVILGYNKLMITIKSGCVITELLLRQI